jgi:hypothetical protein
MKLKFHKTLTLEKWSGFPMFKRILMIGSELQRAKNLIVKNDTDETNRCFERAFELIDMTIESTDKKSLRMELLRFRDLLAEQYTKKVKDKTAIENLFGVLLTLNSDAFKLLAKGT